MLDSEGLEWWPSRGTLIALLRHGSRAGFLSKGKLDVVDHDVDIMVGISSHAEWSLIRRSILDKLVDRGWSHCFERYSTGVPEGMMEHQLARGDLFLCVRQNPRVTLDIATYLSQGSVAYAQRYCVYHHATALSCWIPHENTFRGSRGRLRVSAIRPLGRCKAGSFSVPCPHRPLETLRAMMPENYSASCIALPDVPQRQKRSLYDSDNAEWLSEGLTQEDVAVLRAKAADLDREGYKSMTPYFSRCRWP